MHEAGVVDEDIPGLLYIYTHSNYSLRQIYCLKLRGATWDNLSNWCGVPLYRDRSGPPYGNAYGAITGILLPSIGRDPGGRTIEAGGTQANGGTEGAEEVGITRTDELLVIAASREQRCDFRLVCVILDPSPSKLSDDEGTAPDGRMPLRLHKEFQFPELHC